MPDDRLPFADDLLITTAQLSSVIDRAESTIEKDRLAGRGVPFRKIGRQVRYRVGDIREYIRALPSYLSTSEFSGAIPTRSAPIERQGGALPIGDGPAPEINPHYGSTEIEGGEGGLDEG